MRDSNFIFPVLLLLFCLFLVHLCPNYKIYKLASHRLGTFPLSLSVFLKGKHKGKFPFKVMDHQAQCNVPEKSLYASKMNLYFSTKHLIGTIFPSAGDLFYYSFGSEADSRKAVWLC